MNNKNFKEHLKRYPGDTLTRKVYADWLEEHGNSQQAMLQRQLAEIIDEGESEGFSYHTGKKKDPRFVDFELRFFIPTDSIRAFYILRNEQIQATDWLGATKSTKEEAEDCVKRGILKRVELRRPEDD